MLNKNKNIIDPLTIAAATYPVIKRRAKGTGAKPKYTNPNGARVPQPALFLLNADRQPVRNDFAHVYVTEALRQKLEDIADRFHAKGMICGSRAKALSVLINSPEFDKFAEKMCAKMVAHVDGGAARFEFDNTAAATHEEVDGDQQDAEEG